TIFDSRVLLLLTRSGERTSMKRTDSPCVGVLFLLVALVPTSNSSGKDEKRSVNRVSGKVLLDGKPVAGQVIFLGAGDKEQPPAPTNADGKYFLVGPPAGKYKVVVRPLTMSSDKGPKLPALP